MNRRPSRAGIKFRETTPKRTPGIAPLITRQHAGRYPVDCGHLFRSPTTDLFMNRTEHRVQGLNNDEAIADWPPINAREIAWLAGRFPQLADAGQVQWHSPRPMSAAAIVEAAEGHIFIKRHHCSVRSVITLGEEHHFIAHLAAAGVPVVELLRDVDGSTAVEHNNGTYELHKVASGLDLYRDKPSWTPITRLDHATAAGKMLATLHQASAQYHAPQRRTHMLVARDDLIRSHDPLAMLQGDLADRPALASYLAKKSWQRDLTEAVLPWHAALAGRLQNESRLWAHNDWHASNLLWHDEGNNTEVAAVFDFGLASPTSALFDLATAIERNAVAWLELESGAQAVHINIALALLDGYCQIRPLITEQRHLLADLLPIVHLDFALSEVEYFHGATGSTANADVAYHDFLLGHARWFNTPAGQALLAALHTST
jgi:Ser/Thr protein kinase RdoA (MazF antagonist)